MTVIVFCGPASFGGSGHIMTTCLQTLAHNGVEVHYVGDRRPFHLADGVESTNATVRTFLPVLSGAVGHHGVVKSSDALFELRLTEHLIATYLDVAPYHRTIVIWAHYLFPYGTAAVAAAKILSPRGLLVQVWLTPAGSDVWELSPQLPNVARALLSADEVQRICTYSKQFAAEVQTWTTREVQTFKPSISDHIRPPTDNERLRSRSELGIAAQDFVVSMHCNMRAVKDPHAVVDVAKRVAERLRSRRVFLLMSGPEIELERGLDPLRVQQMGVIPDVRAVLHAADVEINLSRHDSFNLSLAEAMASALPVVTTDIVGVSDDIRMAKCGVLVPLAKDNTFPARYSTAVDALCDLATDENLRREMGARGAEWANHEFTENSLWQQLSLFLATDSSSVNP